MITLLLATTSAWPCAAIVHDTDVLAESAEAEVLLVANGDGTSTAVYTVSYDGDASELGWIVPIPGTFVSLEDDDDELTFEPLRQGTAPLVERYYDEGVDGGGCQFGCGAASKGGDRANLGTENGTQDVVIAEGFTGTYAFTVVDSGATELDTWLADNGWDLGEASEDLDYYAALGHPLALVRITPEAAQTPPEGGRLPPLALTWEGATLSFPSVMARHGSADEQRTTVYVLGGGRAEVSGWTSEQINLITGTLDDDPVALWEDALRAQGAEGGWVLTFAGDWDGRFVTRFDTLAPRQVHTQDAVFTMGDETESADVVIVLEGSGGAGTAALLLPLLGLGWGTRRRLSAPEPPPTPVQT